jgi:hypothetical protein
VLNQRSNHLPSLLWEVYDFWRHGSVARTDEEMLLKMESGGESGLE